MPASYNLAAIYEAQGRAQVKFRQQNTSTNVVGCTPEEFERYRTLVRRYAHEPRSWARKLRYGLGRLLCGHRPFAPYLDHDRWESACRTPTQP